MARKLNTDLWKKAYLIEFMSKDGKHVEDSFTFSVPPESEEITYSQRKSETKTFGGLHVDDYGLDAVKISLSGSTINQDMKKIYNPKKPGENNLMSGEQEIYHLRDLIHKYKTGDKLKEETIIMLYDLSKMGNGQSMGDGVIKNYWQVFPGDFKIRRASDKPFTYKYSIEFTAVDYDSTRNFNFGNEPSWEWVKNALNWAKENSEALKGYITDNPIINGMKRVKEKMDEVDSNLRSLMSLVDIAAGLINSTFVYTDTLLDIGNTAYSILNIPRDTTQKTLNLGLEIMNSGLKFLKSVESLSYDIQSTLESAYDDPKGYFFPEKILDRYYMTKEEYVDTWKIILRETEDSANDVASRTKNGNLPNIFFSVGNQGPETEETSTTPTYRDQETSPKDTETGQMRLVLTYGDQEAFLKETDTFESLSTEFYGTLENAIVIAMYNGVASIDEFNPGDAIKIPILTPSGRHLLNRIYARPEDRDNYGRDIYLDDEGYTAASTTGDFKLTDGPNNLAQAVLLRLRESVVKRIRLNTYGIRTNITDPVAGAAYILSSIDLTVNAEPRVQSVDAIRFSGKGDGLDVTVEYTDINSVKGNVAGGA
jgi:hypothetical protein